MKCILKIFALLIILISHYSLLAQDNHIDTDPFRHKHPITFSRHTNTPYTAAEARQALTYATSLLQKCDNKVTADQDVACMVTLEATGPVVEFGAAADGLDIINTEAEMNALLANNTAFVKVVTMIQASAGNTVCGVDAAYACATTPGSSIVIEGGYTSDFTGKILLHEFGHSQSLPHRNAPGNPIMHANVGALAVNEVNQDECKKYHNGFNIGIPDGMNRPVDLEFVVDDTGSMSEEIASVINTILKVLALPKYTENPCGYVFQLTTFKDNVSPRAPTTDLNVIRNQVLTLVASGGGECPEASVEAVEAIKNNIKDNGAIMIFTDAAPHPGTNIEAVTAELKVRGVTVSTLLSNDCTAASFSSAAKSSQQTDNSANENPIPLSDNHDSGNSSPVNENGQSSSQGLLSSPVSAAAISPNPTAIEAFSYMAQETGGVFAYVPEINSGNPADRFRYENIAFNIIVGSIAPAITNIEPARGPVGGTVAITISASRTNFNGTTALTFSDPGIVVKEVKVISPTKLEATITVGSTVSIGYKDVKTSTLSDGGIVDTASGTGLFQVIAAPTTPTIVSIAPPSGSIGQVLTVKITGINTRFDNTSVVNMGAGITVLSVTALSDVELQADIQIAPNATPGFRNVVVTTGTQVATENVPGPFLVTTGGDSCDVSALNVGSDKTVNLFYPDSSCTTLSVNGIDSAASNSYSYRWSTGDTTATINVCPTATTVYTVTVTRETCTFTGSVTVIVNSCPADVIVTAPSCTDRVVINWNEPADTYPSTITIPGSLDPGNGKLTFIGSLNGHGYYKSTNAYAWPVARDITEYIGGSGVKGHLATLTDETENSFIYNKIKDNTYLPWIGLYNTGRVGRFRWVTNEDFGYSKWQPGEPNNYGGNARNIAEPYVQISGGNGNWNDISSNALPFIAEFEKPLLKYRQIAGPKNGSSRRAGVYQVCYERVNTITDRKDTCCFNVTVQCESSAIEDPALITVAPSHTINEAITGFNVIASPNPSPGHFSLKVTSDDYKARINMKVTDITGREIEIKNGVVPNQVVQLGNNYKPGIYLVQVLQGSRKVVLTLIKQSR